MTLLEVMVAMVVGTILLLGLVAVLGSTSDTYAKTGSMIETLRDGRAALGMIRRDMAGRLPRTATMPMFYRRDASGFATRLGVFTALPARAQERGRASGDVCYMQYYTAVAADASGKISRKLYRKVTSSSDLLAVLGKPGFQPPAPDPANDDALAFNVLDFRAEFRLFDDASKQWKTATSDADIQLATELLLVLRVLANDAASQLETEAAWSPGSLPPPGAKFDFDADESDDAAVQTFRARILLDR